MGAFELVYNERDDVMDAKKLRSWGAYVKICYDRGGSLTNLARNVMMFAMAFKVYEVGAVMSFVLAIVISVGFIGVGFLDERYGVFKAEQEQMTGEINPHLKKVGDDLTAIKNHLGID